MPQQNNHHESFATWLLGVVTLVLRILLWPLRRLSFLLFPANEMDGLSPAVTAKAVQAFVKELRVLSSNSIISDLFCQSGFAAVRSEAQNELILVYLHSPLQGKDDLKRLLLSDSMIQYFGDNAACLKVFGCSIHTAQGAHLAQSLHAASFPLVALLQPSTNNALQLVYCAQGPVLQNMSTTQLQAQLHTAVQRQQLVLQEAEARRLQREAEAQLRREQDAEYQETLRQDQERQRLLMEEQERQAELQRLAALQQEQEQQALADKINQARALVEDEPTSGNVTRVRFVLPTGTKMNRTFCSNQQIKALRAYLTVYFHDHPLQTKIENIGLSTNYPKKTYNDEQDNELTLEEAGLCPQAVLMVQDLDA